MSELYHFGIKKRSGRYPYGSGKNPKAAIRDKTIKAFNINKWGKDSKHNILFITGLSGSGKSTLADNICRQHRANKINLDLLLEYGSKQNRRSTHDSEFQYYLDRHFPDYKLLKKQDLHGTKKFDQLLDTMQYTIEKFGETQFPKRKVVVEGTQLMDGTYTSNMNFYNDKPMIVTKTSALKSFYRAYRRDNLKFKDFIRSPQYTKEYIDFYKYHSHMKYRLIKNMTESVKLI